MADTQSQQDAVDTGLSVADDTTDFDESDPEQDILGVEVSMDELDEGETEEAATESEDPEADESTEEVQEEEAEQSEEPSNDEENEDERRRRNDEYARRRIEEKEKRELQKRDQQAQYLQSAEDARDLALRQLQVDAYNNRVLTNSNLIESQMDRAVADIDLFRTGSQEAKDELIASLDDFERMYVTRDSNGDPIEVRANLHEFLTRKSESIRRLTEVGARQQIKAKDKTKAKTDAIPNRAPKEPKKDPMVEAFDEEADL